MSFFFASGESTDVERQFRDGRRTMPEYLADLMAPIETEDLTYDEALALVNKGMLGNVVGTSMQTMVDEHMREVNRDGNR